MLGKTPKEEMDALPLAGDDKKWYDGKRTSTTKIKISKKEKYMYTTLHYSFPPSLLTFLWSKKT